MTTFYGYKRLAKPDDWKDIVGRDNWVPSHSAYELAHSWQSAGGVPAGIANALAALGAPLAGLRLDSALVEKPVFLDTQRAPSMTDLMGYARNAASEPVILAVEGKAQETFGLPVRSWLRGDALEFAAGVEPRKTRTRRFEFLCERLGLGVDHECQLRYQLLHRTVSAVLEGELHGAAAVVVVVHAFGPQSAGNWTDYQLFLEALGAKPPTPGVVAGPLGLGRGRKTVTYFLWWQDHLGRVT
jgi:hypothetical protein